MREKNYIVIGLSTLLVVFVINMVLLGFNVNLMSKVSCNDEVKVDYDYLIHYYHGYNMYDIISYKDENTIKVVTYAQVKCEVKNCEFPKTSEYKLKKLDKYKAVFEKIFDGRLYNEMSLYAESIDESYKGVINEVVGLETSSPVTKPIEGKKKYEIVDKYDDNRYVNRGYYFIEDENSVVIASGSKNTGGYSIDVSNIVINGNDVTIYVRETSPSPMSSVTMAFTYPTVKVRFYFEVGNITVLNEDGSEFKGSYR